MSNKPTRTYQDAARDLAVQWASIYPSAISSGVSYWAEMVAVASNYYGDVTQTIVALSRDPSAANAFLTDLVTRFKAYLTQSGDVAERTLLDFNRRIEAGARTSQAAVSGVGTTGHPGVLSVLQRIADVGTREVWKTAESPTTDLGAVTRELEQLLAELRTMQESTRDGSSGTPSG